MGKERHEPLGQTENLQGRSQAITAVRCNGMGIGTSAGEKNRCVQDAYAEVHYNNEIR